MIEIGKYHSLKVEKLVDFGLYLTDGQESILLPKKWVKRDMLPGTDIEVFIYKDNEERPIATTMKPLASVGEFAFLEVVDVNDHGAFLDWGIEKDIFVPFKEQNMEMQVGRSYVVYIYIDSITDRVTATTKLNRYFNNKEIPFSENDTVQILISKKTDLGFEAVINNRYKGLLYDNEIFENIKVGDLRKAYIKKIRTDEKIDLHLQGKDFGISEDAQEIILKHLKTKKGFLALHDKSEPDEIQQVLQMSKKAFKKAIGVLYKEKKILITEKGIQLLDEQD